jgi:Fic family protein
MFEPQLDMSALEPLLRDLEEERRLLLAMAVPPLLERWLRRDAEARGAHMSTRIEGNPLTEPQVREVLSRPPADPDAATRENLDYRDATRMARQVAGDASADVDGGLIRALHYVTVRTTDTYATAGQYRTQQNAVVSGRQVIYLPPHPTHVARAMDEMVAWLRRHRGDLHPLVLAAVAHLECVSIHPFDDGNGRTTRALTVYVLERHGWGLRGFVSSERIFGDRVTEYYEALQRAHGPRYGGPSDPHGWVEWFLRGFLRVLREVREDIERYRADEAQIRASLAAVGLPERAAAALVRVARIGQVTRSEYAEDTGVSDASAVTDLRVLVAAGWLERRGAGRGTRYVAGMRLSVLGSPSDPL